ncbi:hypothetical protein WJX74_003149 [Apatococcus lobatus]|uniref:Uncharacterized protein n=1 Tax=Apatococcus lobatus TaxID=904363 RepID=A0AAW1Q5W4_9CHLO
MASRPLLSSSSSECQLSLKGLGPPRARTFQSVAASSWTRGHHLQLAAAAHGSQPSASPGALDLELYQALLEKADACTYQPPHGQDKFNKTHEGADAQFQYSSSQRNSGCCSWVAGRAGENLRLQNRGREGEIPGAALQAMRRLSSTSASTAPHELTSESLEVFEVALEILQSLDNAAWTLAFIADATTIWPSLNSHSSNLSRWTSRSGGTIIAGRAALH